MSRLRYSPEAAADLAAIKEYITAELGNPVAAIRTVSNIAKRIRKLAEFPGIGAPLSSVADIETDYRFIVCKNYLAFYRIEASGVYIIRVLYGKRDYLSILFGERLSDEDFE